MSLINISINCSADIKISGCRYLRDIFDSEQGCDKWIPVERSLPDFATPVLVSSPSLPHAVVAVYEGRELWRIVGGGIAGNVTHWQPLPEKAKAEG